MLLQSKKRIAPMIRACMLGGAILVLASTPAFAARPIEDAIFKGPMPHQQAHDGSKLKVHYVGRHMLDPMGKGESLKSLQHQVQECVVSTTKGKRPVNPPTTWPEEAMLEMRIDSYYAFNRGITYEHGVQFGVNPIDCSLTEMEISTAAVHSSYGLCQIDLLNKTYGGDCDPKAHEHAQVTLQAPMPSPGQQAEHFAKLKADPKTAAMATAMEAAMAMAPKPTGAVKTFDGVKCHVMALTTPFKGTECTMVGGSFVPSPDAVESGPHGILLEMNVPNVAVNVAEHVKLDIFVDAAVFAPHAKPGFTDPSKLP